MQKNVRVRFAPSPTGPLHMGGVRTALYNYLFAKKHNGTFILRIEDTDQGRFVPQAEQYIIDSLNWCNIKPEEGIGFGEGQFGPYKQSERSAIYKEYAQQLLENGKAYIAFDTAEELEKRRQEAANSGSSSWQYDANNRNSLNNSLTLSKEEVAQQIAAGKSYVIRFKMPENKSVSFTDMVRGEVSFDTALLDDKVLVKGDGLPTYHLANVVDDYLMKITHVIRGEEWLPSTPLHVILYQSFGWESEMPQFAHLPLILRPDGKGKLSKRDGDKLGIPVFPLHWTDPKSGEETKGFRERGYLPEAFLNLLALLGWHPENDQEVFSIDELVDAFSLERVSKSGARFDIEKAVWFNEQYLRQYSGEELAEHLKSRVAASGYTADQHFLVRFSDLMKERVSFLHEFLDKGYYFFEPVKEYDQKTIRKKWKVERNLKFAELQKEISNLPDFKSSEIEQAVKRFMEENGFGFGDVLPILRIAITGTMQGPPIFETMELLGKNTIMERMEKAFVEFGTFVAAE